MNLQELLENYFYNDENAASQSFQEIADEDFNKWLTENNIKEEHIEQVGGEGQGDNYYVVYLYTKGDEKVYIKFSGYYSSFEGPSYEGYYVVNPVVRQVTFYE